MRSTGGHIRGNCLAIGRVDRKVRLLLGPVLWWLPQIAHVNSETRAVDEQVDKSMVVTTRNEISPRALTRRDRLVWSGMGSSTSSMSASDRQNPSVCRS